MVATKLAQLAAHRPNGSAEISAVTQAEAAKLLSVSRETVQHARTVQQHGSPEEIAAVERGEAELVEAMDRGEVSISAAGSSSRRRPMLRGLAVPTRGLQSVGPQGPLATPRPPRAAAAPGNGLQEAIVDPVGFTDEVSLFPLPLRSPESSAAG